MCKSVPDRNVFAHGYDRFGEGLPKRSVGRPIVASSWPVQVRRLAAGPLRCLVRRLPWPARVRLAPGRLGRRMVGDWSSVPGTCCWRWCWSVALLADSTVSLLHESREVSGMRDGVMQRGLVHPDADGRVARDVDYLVRAQRSAQHVAEL